MRTRLLCSIALGSALLGCDRSAPTATSPAAGPSPNFLIAGQPTGDLYRNVALMVIRADAASPWQPWCSGTLVAHDVVLTAGHCVFVAQNFLGLPEFGVTFDNELSPAAEVIGVKESHLDPDFFFTFPFATPDNPIDMHDLALLVLDHNVDRVPARLPPPGFLDHLGATSKELTIVGYGMTTATTDNRGSRYVGTVKLVNVFDAVFQTLPDPTAICGGDSGGPVFLGSQSNRGGERGVTMILGLSHFTNCATLNMHYRVDTPQARAFLGQYLDLPGGSAAVRQ
jgi:trypsin